MFCCREGITNAIRHGGAQSINLIARFLENSLHILIADDGAGCDSIKPGMGLKAMEERLHHAGGVLRWQSASEEGMLLVFDIPMKKGSFQMSEKLPSFGQYTY